LIQPSVCTGYIYVEILYVAMEMRFEYAIFSVIIIVILGFTGFFAFSTGHINIGDQDIRVIYGIELDSIIIFATSILAGALFLISVLAYRKDKRGRYLFVSGAFFLFTVEGLLLTAEAFTNNEWLEPAAHILNLGVLLLFFAGLVKK
jgi:hypothetical protein